MQEPEEIKPKEKLERLLKPKCVEDYGLSMDLSELMLFDEGRKWAKEFFSTYVPIDKWPTEIG